MSSVETTRTTSETLLAMTIRELTDRYPQTMPILAAQGLDLCCGGGHQLGEALVLHGIDRSVVLPVIQSIVDAHDSAR